MATKINIKNKVIEVLNEVPIDFGGGCSISKAYKIGWLIKHFNLKTTLDIGVYRGRSFLPQIIAHKYFTGGIAYGVDPWDKQEAMENDNEKLYDQMQKFVKETDFNKLLLNLKNIINKHEFQDFSKIIRLRSDEAIGYFLKNKTKFDLIHIDGNHDYDKVKKDVQLYLPLLKENGFLLMDDISWDSIKPICIDLETKMDCIFSQIDNENDYCIMINKGNTFKSLYNKFLISFYIK